MAKVQPDRTEVRMKRAAAAVPAAAILQGPGPVSGPCSWSVRQYAAMGPNPWLMSSWDRSRASSPASSIFAMLVQVFPRGHGFP